MKRGLSTGTPTRAEAYRIETAKEGPCIACLLMHERGDLVEKLVVYGCDYHHLTSGGIRRGHRYGIALCVWHHRRQPFGQWTHRQMAAIYGPSLLDGSKAFHQSVGSDAVLLARQDALLDWQDTEEKAA